MTAQLFQFLNEIVILDISVICLLVFGSEIVPLRFQLEHLRTFYTHMYIYIY